MHAWRHVRIHRRIRDRPFKGRPGRVAGGHRRLAHRAGVRVFPVRAVAVLVDHAVGVLQRAAGSLAAAAVEEVAVIAAAGDAAAGLVRRIGQRIVAGKIGGTVGHDIGLPDCHRSGQRDMRPACRTPVGLARDVPLARRQIDRLGARIVQFHEPAVAAAGPARIGHFGNDQRAAFEHLEFHRHGHVVRRHREFTAGDGHRAAGGIHDGGGAGRVAVRRRGGDGDRVAREGAVGRIGRHGAVGLRRDGDVVERGDRERDRVRGRVGVVVRHRHRGRVVAGRSRGQDREGVAVVGVVGRAQGAVPSVRIRLGPVLRRRRDRVARAFFDCESVVLVEAHAQGGRAAKTFNIGLVVGIVIGANRARQIVTRRIGAIKVGKRRSRIARLDGFASPRVACGGFELRRGRTVVLGSRTRRCQGVNGPGGSRLLASRCFDLDDFLRGNVKGAGTGREIGGIL